jgi:hypothetical protein
MAAGEATTPSSGGGDSGSGSCQLARALYAYLSSGENQLSFLEGDVIALMGKYACIIIII